MGILDKLLNQYIGRVVAFALLPFLTAASITVVPWINDVLGTDLTNDQVANAVLAVIVGQILVGWQWLKNRGNWEVADKVQGELFEAYNKGQGYVDDVDEAPVPEGPVK